MNFPLWSMTRLQQRHKQRQLAAIELQVDVPAERRNPRCHRRERIYAERASREKKVSNAANAERMKPLQFGIAD